MQNAFKKLFYTILFIFAAYILFVPIFIKNYSNDYIYDHPTEVSFFDYAIVLGAGVDKYGNPQDILRDRLETAGSLYDQDKVGKILLTGDNSENHLNETDAMFEYMTVELGVPAGDIVVDPLGNRTYDSCARVSENININNAVVITQQFHLERALFLCNNLGLPLYGLKADNGSGYNHLGYFKLREFFAKHKAFIDIYLFEPEYAPFGE